MRCFEMDGVWSCYLNLTSELILCIFPKRWLCLIFKKIGKLVNDWSSFQGFEKKILLK